MVDSTVAVAAIGAAAVIAGGVLTGLLQPAVSHITGGRRRRQELAEKDRDKLGQLFDELLASTSRVWSLYTERLRVLMDNRAAVGEPVADLRSEMEQELDRLDLLVQRSELLGASPSLAEASNELAGYCYDFLCYPAGPRLLAEEEQFAKGQQSAAVAAMKQMKNVMAADLVRLRQAG